MYSFYKISIELIKSYESAVEGPGSCNHNCQGLLKVQVMRGGWGCGPARLQAMPRVPSFLGNQKYFEQFLHELISYLFSYKSQLRASLSFLSRISRISSQCPNVRALWWWHRFHTPVSLRQHGLLSQVSYQLVVANLKNFLSYTIHILIPVSWRLLSGKVLRFIFSVFSSSTLWSSMFSLDWSFFVISWKRHFHNPCFLTAPRQ